MRFWIREAAGWILIGLGLFVFWVCYRMLTADPWHDLIEAGPMSFVGFIIFRGGIHLLKVAVAARICLQAQQQLRPERSSSLPPRGTAVSSAATAPRRT